MDGLDQINKTNVTRQISAQEKSVLYRKIQLDFFKLYHLLVKSGLPSNGIAGLAYIFIIYKPSNRATLLAWYSALIFANLINLFWARRFKLRTINPIDLKILRLGSLVIISSICLLWGSIDILFYSTDAIQWGATLIFLSGALICFSVTAVIDITMGVFCIVCLVTPGIGYNLYLFIMQEINTGIFDKINLSFSIAFAIVGSFLVMMCYYGHKIFMKVSFLGHINELLNQKLEHVNNSLEKRIKKRTKALEYSSALTQATLESTQEGILAISIHGEVLTYNHKFLKQWGITKHFLFSKSIDQFFIRLAERVDNPDYFIKKITEAQEKNTYQFIEFRLKSGVILEYYTHPQCLNKKIIGTIHCFQDITERHRLRLHAALQDRLAITGRLVANVAHEVNNPIAWILSNLQLIEKQFNKVLQAPDPDEKTCLSYVSELKEVVNESIDGAVRIQEIVQMFNHYGRIDKEEASPIKIHNIINTSLNMAMIQTKNHIKVEKNFTPEAPCILGNTNKLHQVFLNLLINAVDSFTESTSENKLLTIKTQVEGDFFRIDITDTGIGISPETMSHLFEPFFTTKPTNEGTGLGLSICKDILTTYGGKITAQSTFGQGSTFSVYLPISNPHQSDILMH